MIPPYLTLSNIRYVSRVKWKNPGIGVAPSTTLRCSSYWKGSFWSPSTTDAIFILLTHLNGRREERNWVWTELTDSERRREINHREKREKEREREKRVREREREQTQPLILSFSFSVVAFASVCLRVFLHLPSFRVSTFSCPLSQLFRLSFFLLITASGQFTTKTFLFFINWAYAAIPALTWWTSKST